MQAKKLALMLGLSVTVLAACGKQSDAPAPEPQAATVADPDPALPDAASQAPAATLESAPESAPVETAAATNDAASAGPEAVPGAADTDGAAAPAAGFDIGAIATSAVDLPAWPYAVLPEGYRYSAGTNLDRRTRDLARVPVWTGSELLWVEGKVFEDSIRTADGKTWSRYEVSKLVRDQLQALGAVQLADRSVDKATYEASQKELDQFRREFTHVRDAYWYGRDVDTFVIRRADSAIWIVLQVGNGSGAVLVAEGPAPTAQ